MNMTLLIIGMCTMGSSLVYQWYNEFKNKKDENSPVAVTLSYILLILGVLL